MIRSAIRRAFHAIVWTAFAVGILCAIADASLAGEVARGPKPKRGEAWRGWVEAN